MNTIYVNQNTTLSTGNLNNSTFKCLMGSSFNIFNMSCIFSVLISSEQLSGNLRQSPWSLGLSRWHRMQKIWCLSVQIHTMPLDNGKRYIRNSTIKSLYCKLIPWWIIYAFCRKKQMLIDKYKSRFRTTLESSFPTNMLKRQTSTTLFWMAQKMIVGSLAFKVKSGTNKVNEFFI